MHGRPVMNHVIPFRERHQWTRKQMQAAEALTIDLNHQIDRLMQGKTHLASLAHRYNTLAHRARNRFIHPGFPGLDTHLHQAGKIKHRCSRLPHLMHVNPHSKQRNIGPFLIAQAAHLQLHMGILLHTIGNRHHQQLILHMISS